MIKITEEMQQRVDKAFEEKKYCVWATTSDDGFPDMSFRGSTFVFDDEHLAFRHRSFGASTTNLESGPPVCSSSTKKTAWAGAFTARRRFTRTAIWPTDHAPHGRRRTRQRLRTQGLRHPLRVDKICRYSGFNVVQER